MIASQIVEAKAPHDVAAVKSLFLEYAESLDFELCFQNFDEEMETFPGSYRAPRGVLLLARVELRPAGAIGLRPYPPEPGTCEMKRLYVKLEHRGLGLGRGLALTLLHEAAARRYTRMRLDTIESMREAQAIYEKLGFERTAPYYNNPLKGVVYYQRLLADITNPAQVGGHNS